MPSNAADTGALVDEDQLSRLLDDLDFQEVHARMSRFNLFEAVGAVRGELRHSNFLAYLLSPARNHGFGARPLVNFLRAVLELIPAAKRPIRTLELIVGDLTGAIVHRERDNIDLIIEIDSLDLVVIVENKIDARATDGQLERYQVLTAGRYPTLRKLYVFLTPSGIDPDHPAYVAFSYAELAVILSNITSDAADESESTLIIRHYVDMLRRHIVPDPQLRELAARLYERHSDALEFIMECRPQQGGVLEHLAEVVEGTSGLMIDSRGANILRFVPEVWDQSLTTIRCDPALWSRTGRAILFELKTPIGSPGRANVSLTIGPAASEVRIYFYNAARDRPELFRGLVKPMGAKWTTVFSQDLITSTQAKGLTLDQQGQQAGLAWSDFQATSLPALIGAILEIDARRTTSQLLIPGATGGDLRVHLDPPP